mgnify:CR=1 FL=1|tara:strand:+ start:218 stop:565 length:348 start_codon:yes stop_codon:yes gene_type:complete
MSEYNWCHNPSCHTIETQSRIRGSGDNKVLRTVKIRIGNHWRQDSIFDFFCNQQCLFQFLNKFRQEIANIRPVREPSETPIKVKKWQEERYRYQYSNGQSNRVPYQSTRTEIESK